MSTMLSLSEPVLRAAPPLLGVSRAMQQARHLITRVAPTSLPVLLVGPTGTGKELLARHLHEQSGRRGERVDVNCGALPRDMVESLLFGHRKGAFTGAVESRAGLIRRADHGTLFLDELASLPLEGQAKLLRVLETGEVLPLGEHERERVQFRLVSAVQEDIRARIESGVFRRDLYHRVAGIEIVLPPLSKRREDIPLLVSHFATDQGCIVSGTAIAMLTQRAWPGNVRELRACIDRAALLAGTTILGLEAFADEEILPPASGGGAVSELLALCRVHGANASTIAAELGVSRATLFRRLRRAGISLTRLRVSSSLETG